MTARKTTTPKRRCRLCGKVFGHPCQGNAAGRCSPCQRAWEHTASSFYRQYSLMLPPGVDPKRPLRIAAYVGRAAAKEPLFRKGEWEERA